MSDNVDKWFRSIFLEMWKDSGIDIVIRRMDDLKEMGFDF